MGSYGRTSERSFKLCLRRIKFMKKITGLLFLLCFASLFVQAQEAVQVPADVQPFVEQNTKPIALESADLNGDGTKDFILVLEDQKPKKSEEDFEEGFRSLLILVRGADGKLSLAKRNNDIVYCRTCGGVFGDPFDSVEVGLKTFTVHLYGGSSWRWSYGYKFNYSRIDKTWQLVRVEESTFHTSEPDKAKTKIYTPPKDFGKIDIADFEPENYLKKGKKR